MASSKMQRAREFLRRQREKARDVAVQVRTDAETVGAGAGIAYLRSRFPNDFQVGDIDVELIAGVPLKLAAYMNLLGRSVSPDLHAISNGILTAYAAQQAAELGAEHREQDTAVEGRRRRNVMGAAQPNVYPMGQGRQGVAR